MRSTSLFLFCFMLMFGIKYMIAKEENTELKSLRELDNKVIEDLQNRLKKHNIDYSIG